MSKKSLRPSSCTIPHLPGCFCPWSFFQNIGFKMVPSDPFMSHLATRLWSDCPCDVWCRGLTTCLLHVGPHFGNRVLNTSWAVGLTCWIVYLHFLHFDICNYIWAILIERVPPKIWCWHPLHFANTNSKDTKRPHHVRFYTEIFRHNTIFQILFFFSIFRVYIAKFLTFLIKCQVRPCHMMSSCKKYNTFYSIQATYVVSLSNTNTLYSTLHENIYLTRRFHI